MLVQTLSITPIAKGRQGDTESGESIEMGPMTLREYIATLQPYDPEIHGWRGDEPWTLRRQRSRSQQCCANGVASSPADGPAYSSVSYRPGTRGSPQHRAQDV